MSKSSDGRIAEFEDCVNWRIMEIEVESWKIERRDTVKFNKIQGINLTFSKKNVVEMTKQELIILRNENW